MARFVTKLLVEPPKGDAVQQIGHVGLNAHPPACVVHLILGFLTGIVATINTVLIRSA